MTTLALHRDTNAAALVKPVPRPRTPISIRVAAEGKADVKFIDDLQKLHSKMVGWMPTQQLEGHVKAGHVLIADDELKRPIGYCMHCDRYFKREDCGIIYQLNVTPGRQRGLIGAALIKAAFERSAYGCRLYCCWCAQDIAANHFWESLGFVPLAFRAGSRGKDQGGTRKEGRVRIFWQRRIREGDAETPYWFPSQTTGGALREDRLVLPIPPGTHWSDAKPLVLPGQEQVHAAQALEGDVPKPRKPRVRGPKPKVPVTRSNSISSGGLRFAPTIAAHAVEAQPPPRKPKREKQKNDPKYIAAARELRDRYLEEVNAPGSRLLPGAQGKYDVSRQLEAAPTELKQMPLLKAA